MGKHFKAGAKRSGGVGQRPGGDVNATGVYRNVQRAAERMEAELGEEKGHFIEGCQRDWDALPPPGPPITVGMDMQSCLALPVCRWCTGRFDQSGSSLKTLPLGRT